MQVVWSVLGIFPLGQAWQIALLVISSRLQTRQVVWFGAGTAPTGQAWQMPSLAISLYGQAVHMVRSIFWTSPLRQAILVKIGICI